MTFAGTTKRLHNTARQIPVFSKVLTTGREIPRTRDLIRAGTRLQRHNAPRSRSISNLTPCENPDRTATKRRLTQGVRGKIPVKVRWQRRRSRLL